MMKNIYLWGVSWLRANGLLGNAGLRTELEACQSDLNLAIGALEIMEKTNVGLNNAIGLLQKRNDETNRAGMVTIACLLTTAGGEVSVSPDLVAAIQATDINIKYNSTQEGGCTLTLVQGDCDCDTQCEEEE